MLNIDNLDLNIENYTFNDILNLFKLSVNFNKQDLKQVYKVILKVHPDKSGLDNKYFLFYVKAFKILKNTYEYNERISKKIGEECTHRKYNIEEGLSKSKEVKSLIDKLLELKPKQFHETFNSMFEQATALSKQEENGYGDWLKTDEGILDENIQSVQAMNEAIERNKRIAREKALVQYRGIQDVETQGGYSIVDNVEGYSSGLFSKTQYEDLKKAYTETLVPVTEEDYRQKRQYSSVDELQKSRKGSERLLTEKEYQLLLERQMEQEGEKSIKRNYELVRQAEMAKKQQDIFLSSLRQLKN